MKPYGSSSDVTLDWAEGSSENNFELTVNDIDVSLGDWFWVDGTGIGGYISDRKVTVSGGVSASTWSGPTWAGMLSDKILTPDAGKDYLTFTGDASTVVQQLVNRAKLNSVYTVKAGESNPQISYTFQDPRFPDAYTALASMLASVGMKPVVVCSDNRILLSPEPVTTVSNTVNSDLVDFTVETANRRTNHLIGLGKGDLKNRVVVHWYADKDGNVSQKQSLFGADEVTEVYEYSNADTEQLNKKTREKLVQAQSGGSVDVDLDENTAPAVTVGDRVVASDMQSGVTVTAKVTKRISKIINGVMTITYEVGDASSRSVRKNDH